MKQKIAVISVISFLTIVFFTLKTSTVLAAKTLNDATTILDTAASGGGYEGSGDVSLVIGNIVKGALAATGVIFFALTVYAGMLWMTARGKDDQIDTARNTIIASVIGLVIVVGSYAITSFVQNNIILKNSGGGNATVLNQVGGNGGEPVGCCIDWVGTKKWVFGVSADYTASRWTTLTDCKHWGENANQDGSGDQFACEGGNSGKVGCWIWKDTGTYQQCEELRLNNYTK